MKFSCSINPSYANIYCYKCVQSDRCIFIRLCAISICMVMKPSKGIQQVRWEMNFFHQHHLMIGGICQKQDKLFVFLKTEQNNTTNTSCGTTYTITITVQDSSRWSMPQHKARPATTSGRTCCYWISLLLIQLKDVLLNTNLYSLLPYY